MPNANGTCEYVLDPDDPETWGGEEGDECYVDDEVLNEDGVWTCPYDAEAEDKDLCIIHQSANRKDEYQVNKFLSNIIEKHSYNIIGAELPAVDISGNSIESENSGALSFIHCHFTEESNFSLINTSTSIDFIGSEFHGDVIFDRAVIKNEMNIRHCEFDSKVSFQATKFNSSDDSLNISDSLFDADLNFEQAHFSGDVFISGIFRGECVMYGTTFESSIRIRYAKFEREVILSSVSSSGNRFQFRNVKCSSLRISGSEISRCWFSESEFGEVTISDTEFDDISFGSMGNVAISGDFELSASVENGLYIKQIDVDGKAKLNGEFPNSKITEDMIDADLLGDFCNSNFKGSDLSKANFSESNLSGSNFERCILSRSDLFGTDFTGAAFYGAVFAEAQINEETEFGERCVYDPEFELESAADIGNDETGRLTKSAGQYRIIEKLARENAFPDMVSHNFIRRQDIHREQHRQKGRWGRWLRATASKYVLEYGENPWRLIATGLIIVVGFGLLYPLVGGLQPTGGSPITASRVIENPLLLAQSIYYSTLTFTTLGMGDFLPVGLGRVLTTLETSLGAIIIALLVFVFGRRAAR